jgi:tetratricopeptide (TPR) repeat protein
LSSRTLSLLRLLIVVLAVGIVLLGGALLRFVLLQDTSVPSTPRTAAERAIVDAQAAVKADPSDANSRIKLAAALLEIGDSAGAMDQARVAVRLKPSDPSVYYILGLAELKAGRNTEAVTHLTKAVKTTGQQAGFYQDAYVALALSQQATGDAKSALSSMNEAVRNGPSNALLYITRAQMYEKSQRWFDAAFDYALALQYTPDLSEARTALDKIRKDHPTEYNQAITAASKFFSTQAPAGSPTTTTP